MLRNSLNKVSDWVLDVGGAILILLVVACIAVTAWNSIDHGSELTKITNLQQQYVGEQTQLANAGTEQNAFALWLVEANDTENANLMVVCASLHLTCQPLPPLPKLKPLK